MWVTEILDPEEPDKVLVSWKTTNRTPELCSDINFVLKSLGISDRMTVQKLTHFTSQKFNSKS